MARAIAGRTLLKSKIIDCLFVTVYHFPLRIWGAEKEIRLPQGPLSWWVKQSPWHGQSQTLTPHISVGDSLQEGHWLEKDDKHSGSVWKPSCATWNTSRVTVEGLKEPNHCTHICFLSSWSSVLLTSVDFKVPWLYIRQKEEKYFMSVRQNIWPSDCEIAFYPSCKMRTSCVFISLRT